MIELLLFLSFFLNVASLFVLRGLMRSVPSLLKSDAAILQSVIAIRKEFLFILKEKEKTVKIATAYVRNQVEN